MSTALGQLGRHRSSATVSASIGMPDSTSTRMSAGQSATHRSYFHHVYNDGQAATKLLDFMPHSGVGGPAMTVKIDSVEPNIFPDVEDLDAPDGGRAMLRCS